MVTESLFEKSFDTVLHQVNGGNVHHMLQPSQQSVHSPKSIDETNQAKKRCAPQSIAMGQSQSPIAQGLGQFPKV